MNSTNVPQEEPVVNPQNRSTLELVHELEEEGAKFDQVFLWVGFEKHSVPISFWMVGRKKNSKN